LRSSLSIANLFEHVISTTVVNIVVGVSIWQHSVGLAEVTTGHLGSALREVRIRRTVRDWYESRALTRRVRAGRLWSWSTLTTTNFFKHVVGTTVVNVVVGVPVWQRSVSLAHIAAGHLGSALREVGRAGRTVGHWGKSRTFGRKGRPWCWRRSLLAIADFSPHVVPSAVVDVVMAGSVRERSVGLAQCAAGHVRSAFGEVSVGRAFAGVDCHEPEGAGAGRGGVHRAERDADGHEVCGAAHVGHDVLHAPVSVEEVHHLPVRQSAVD